MPEDSTQCWLELMHDGIAPFVQVGLSIYINGIIYHSNVNRY